MLSADGSETIVALWLETKDLLYIFNETIKAFNPTSLPLLPHHPLKPQLRNLSELLEV